MALKTFIGSKIEVHEHKAVTDDSARLYGELLEKARKEITESFAISNEMFHAAVFTQQEYGGLGVRLVYVFKLNSKVIQGQCSVDTLQAYRAGSKEGLYKELFKALAESIASELMKTVRL